MEEIFISYSRADQAFVRRLYDGLQARGRNAWVDWEGIPPTDEWLPRIRSAIDAADAFLFVISPNSVVSEVCAVELDHAIKQHKRLIPVLHSDPAGGAVRRELSELNYIFARDTDSLDDAVERVITALDTDLAWTRVHTRLLIRAAEWDGNGRDPSFTLRGRDLNDLEEWLAKSPDKDPKPTSLQSEFVLASRRAVARRQRIVWGSVTVGLSIAVGLGTIAYFQNRERARQETIAQARQLLNKADALRDVPSDKVGAFPRLEESTRAAAQALATLHRLEIPSLDADRAVRKSLGALPKWIDLDQDPGAIDASAFDSVGAHLALFRARKDLIVLDTADRRRTAVCARPLAAMESAVAVAVGSSGALAATAVYDAARGAGATEITVWSMKNCSQRLQVHVQGRRDRIALGGDGAVLVANEGSTLRLWDVTDQSQLTPGFADLVFAFALAPEGHRLATLERNRGERKYWIRLRDLGGEQPTREWEHPDRGKWMQWGLHALVVGSDSTAMVYDPDGGALTHSYSIVAGKFGMSPDGRLVASVLENDAIQIRDAATDAGLARTSLDVQVKDLAFGPDSRSLIAVDAVNRRARVWLFTGGAAYAELRSDAPIEQMRFSRDGSELYAAGVRAVTGWRLPSLGEPPGPPSLLLAAPASEFGRRYRIELPPAGNAGGETPTISLHATDTDSSLRTIALEARVLAAAVSREGDRLAVILATKSTRGGFERRLEVWDIGTAARIANRPFEPVLDPDVAAYLEFAGDDHYLVVGTRIGLEIVDADKLASVATLYQPGVSSTAMQGDGALAAIRGSDNVVRVWNVPDAEEVARIEPGHAAHALALSNDGRWLATLDAAGTVRLWALAPGDLVQQACQWLSEPCP